MDGHAQPLPVAPGTLLAGKYKVEHVLGRGAMGVVVAARHVDLGELFAIKLLLPQALAIPQAVDRFLREARAAARLKGEHVAKVTDVGRLEDGSPYMVMEHLTGTDLQQLVRTRGPLPVDEAVTYILQACDAIAEAHALGIVHRDLKPANLFLIRRRNGTGCVKVLDFGISKQVVQEGVDLTKTSDVFGTPLYMAPEQMARSKNADARSDVWSMGIVLYELITGTTPFHASTITEVVARVLQEDAAPPSAVLPAIPAVMDEIVRRCLQKRPDLRFQSVEDLATALRAVTGAAVRPALPISSPAMVPPAPGASRLAAETATLTLPERESATAHLSAPGVVSPAPVASTASAWGSTGRLRTSRPSGMVIALAAGGALAALLAAGGVWLALRSQGAMGAADGEAPSAIPAESSAPVTSANSESDTTAAPIATAESPPLPAAVPTSSTTVEAVPGVAVTAVVPKLTGAAQSPVKGRQKRPLPATRPAQSATEKEETFR